MRVFNLRSLVRRWWWLIGNCVVAAVAITFLVGHLGEVEYSSEATFVVRAAVDDPAALVRATAALASNDEIASTYAVIATSDLIRDAAELTPEQYDQVQITSSSVPGANVLVIGARSHDPDLAFDTSVVVSELTERYVRELGDVFALTPLDPPRLSETSGFLGLGVLTGAAALGLLGGTALAAVVDRRFRSRERGVRMRNVFDNHVPAFSRRYLQARLAEEVERARSAGGRFSLATLQLVRRNQWADGDDEPAVVNDLDLALVAGALTSTLRPQDILGHLGGGHFVVILPDIGVEAARSAVQDWRKAVTEVLLRDNPARDVAVKGWACEYDRFLYFGDPEAELIAGRL